MKIINIKNKEFFVDDDNFEFLNKFHWQLNYNNYAYISKYSHMRNGKCIYKKIYMHRLIINTPKGMDTDHINRNKFDNRKCNLRVVDRSDNNFNSFPSKKNTSGFKGVSWFKPAKRWRAYIKHKSSNKRIELGYFKIKEDAVNARINAEKKLGVYYVL